MEKPELPTAVAEQAKETSQEDLSVGDARDVELVFHQPGEKAGLPAYHLLCAPPGSYSSRETLSEGDPQEVGTRPRLAGPGARSAPALRC